MNLRLGIIGLTITALLIHPLSFYAQATNDWSVVAALSAGQSVRVETKSGQKLDGEIVSANANGVSVSANGQTRNFDAVDVKKVYRVGKASRGKGAAIGAAIGAGAGAGVGAGALASTGGSDDTWSVFWPFVAIGTGIGAATGALLSRKKRTLIYEAR